MVTAAMKLKDAYSLEGVVMSNLGSYVQLGRKVMSNLGSYVQLGRKVMSNLDSIFKSRDITLPTKVRLIKTMDFPVVIYGCESWTVKKAEC